MSKQRFTNNARTTVAVTLSAGGTSLTVSDGSKFPAPTGGDYFLATLFRIIAGQESGHEVVKCTARTGNVLTIERSYEGASASEFAAGSLVALRPTAKTLEDMQLAGNIALSAIAGISATDLQAAISELNTDKLESSAYTAADVLAKLLTVDGVGSGLNADLLDGQHGDYYNYRNTGLGAQSITISDTDLNDMSRVNGFWMGINLTNAPEGSTDWFLIISRAHNSNWLMQDAYKMTGAGAGRRFQRLLSNGTWQAWEEIWTSNSDGSGSGLDADLLDGFQGSQFLRSDATTTHDGGAFLLKAPNEFWGNRTLAIIPSDSTGSDDWVWRVDNLSTARRIELGQRVGTGTPNNEFTFNDDDGTFEINGNPVWHSGNDGAGSGLDADLLDGQHGSYYDPRQFGLGAAVNTISNLNTLTVTTMGRYAPSTSGAPTTEAGFVIHTSRDDPFVSGFQIALVHATNKMFLRKSTGGTWGDWSQVYGQDNILGTVSESGGVPTGAIIERGSNANGVYIKFADGTLVMTRTVSNANNTLDATDATGPIYRTTSEQQFTLPTTMANTSDVSVSISLRTSGTRWGVIRIVSTTSVSLRVYSTVSNASTTALDFMVIGRWY